ncbi:MAG: glycosyltransferase [Clostridia bacterium]|nr:glycosyltransferase [Clostridia bacterium]
MPMFARVMAYVRRNGLGYTLRRAVEMFSGRVLRVYDRAARRADPSAEELASQRMNPPDAGMISIAIPAWNTRPAFLQALADSLTAQTYANWEAVIYDGCSTDAEAIRSMDALKDGRIRVIHGSANEGIAGNTNRAIAACRGDYIALCDHDDTLTPDALWHVARAIADEAPDLLYSDEDKLTEDGRVRTDPHRKPDFCPDNLRSGNYICHLMVVKRTLLTELGGLRPAFDGSQDHDLTLRIAERTQRICHIPRVLYHWRTVGASMSHQRLQQCQDAAARAVTEHMARIGRPGQCTVEDGVLRLRWDVPAGLTVQKIHVPAGEGYAFINRAAVGATGDVLLILREGVSEPDEAALREMLMYAQRDDVAAVTPMITDRRGRIVHAGYTWDGERVCSRNAGLPGHAGGWHGLNRTSHNVMAVSTDCLMVRRDHFIPFDEGYTGGLGAVDWCRRLWEWKLRCVYTPHAQIVCDRPERTDDPADMARLLAAWPDLRDPCRTGSEV